MAADAVTQPEPVVICSTCGLSTYSAALAELVTECPRCEAPVAPARPRLTVVG